MAEPVKREVLDDDAHGRIFREIEYDALSRSSRVDKPVAVLFGGQMGAGKTTAVHNAKKEFDPKIVYVGVDVDALRRRHQKYSALMRTDEKNVTYHTHPDASKWNQELTSSAIKNGRNLVVDTLMSNPKITAYHANNLREAGYKTHAVFIATPDAISRQACIYRYESEKAIAGAGRKVNLESHDIAYDDVAHSVAELEKGKAFDRIEIRDRDGNVLYDSDSHDKTQKFSSATEALEAGRNIPPTLRDLSRYYDEAIKISEWMKARGAPIEDQNDAIDTVLKAQNGHFKNLFTSTNAIKPTFLSTLAPKELERLNAQHGRINEILTRRKYDEHQHLAQQSQSPSLSQRRDSSNAEGVKAKKKITWEQDGAAAQVVTPAKGSLSPDIGQALNGVPSDDLLRDLRTLEEVGGLIVKKSRYDPYNVDSALYKSPNLGSGPKDREVHTKKLEQVRNAIFASIDSYVANAPPGENRQIAAGAEKAMWENFFQNSRVQEDFSYRSQRQYATDRLDLSHQGLTQISPTVFALPGLRSLNVANNQLAELHIGWHANDAALERIDANGNPFESLNTLTALAQRGTRVVIDDPHEMPLRKGELETFEAHYDKMEANAHAIKRQMGKYEGIYIPTTDQSSIGYKKLDHLTKLRSHAVYEKLMNESYTLTGSLTPEEVGQHKEYGHIAARFTYDTTDGKKQEVHISYSGGYLYGDRKDVQVKCSDERVALLIQAHLVNQPIYNARKSLTDGNLEKQFEKFLSNNRHVRQEAAIVWPNEKQQLAQPSKRVNRLRKEPLLNRILSFIARKVESVIRTIGTLLPARLVGPTPLQKTWTPDEKPPPSYDEVIAKKRAEEKVFSTNTSQRVTSEDLSISDSKLPPPPPYKPVKENIQQDQSIDSKSPVNSFSSSQFVKPPPSLPARQTSFLAEIGPSQRPMVPLQNNKALQKKYSSDNGDFFLRSTGEKAFHAQQEGKNIRFTLHNTSKEVLTDTVRVAKMHGGKFLKIDTQDKKLASQLFEICSREGVVPQMSPEMRPSNAEINKVREKLLSEVKDMPKEKIFSRHDPKEVESAHDIPVGSTVVSTTDDGFHIFMKPGASQSAIGQLYAVPASKINPRLDVGGALTENHKQSQNPTLGPQNNAPKAKVH